MADVVDELDAYDALVREGYRLAGFSTGRGIGKVASQKEQRAHWAKVKECRSRIAAWNTRPQPTQSSASTERPEAAINALTEHAYQADMEGIMVKVSRQALEETLSYIARLSQPSPSVDVVEEPTTSQKIAAAIWVGCFPGQASEEQIAEYLKDNQDDS